jgi:glycosyltransferase involved in cell wall biosynthesis
MKILYHHRTGAKDGQAVHIEELVNAFRTLGHEVIVVAPPLTEATRFGGDTSFVAWVRRHLPKAVGELLELAYNVPTYLRLRRALRTHRPDFLYERYNLYLLAGAWLARRFKLPYVLEVNAPLFAERVAHGGLGLPRLARVIEGWTWRQAAYVLPVTAVLAAMVEHSGVPKHRIAVIHNGIEPEKFKHYPSLPEAKRRLGLEGSFVLGFTGFVREWNRLDLVIDYLGGPGREQCALVVVGDGPAVRELRGQAAKLGVADRVRFAGVVGRGQVKDWIAAFDVALLPAVTEYASPLKLFEYLALGRAIVAPRQPNLSEVLTDGRNAVLFEPGDAAALHAALDALIHAERRRAFLGRNALATIEDLGLTWLSNARRVCSLFSETKGAGSGRAIVEPKRPLLISGDHGSA